jgi:peptide/nickel transport system substrate-binding protein
VRVATKHPYRWFFEGLGNPDNLPIVPREWLGDDRLRTHIVSAGPYLLTRPWADGRMQITRNASYWNSPVPYIETMEGLLMPDLTAQRTAFASKQLDMYAPPKKTEAEALTRAHDWATTYAFDSGNAAPAHHLNVSTWPGNDERNRRAVSLATDRDQMIQLLQAGQGAHWGILPPTHEQWSVTEEELKSTLQPFDPGEATKLFQATGLTEFPLKYASAGSTPDWVAIITQQFATVGVELKPEPMDNAALLSLWFDSSYDSLLGGHRVYRDPDAALQAYKTGGIAGNDTWSELFSVPAVDEAIDRAATIFDDEEAKEAYLTAQRLIYEYAPARIYTASVVTNRVISNVFQDVPTDAPGFDVTARRWMWRDDA